MNSYVKTQIILHIVFLFWIMIIMRNDMILIYVLMQLVFNVGYVVGYVVFMSLSQSKIY